MNKAEEMFIRGNVTEAFEIFLAQAEKGDGRAMYFLALYYALGLGDIDFPDDVIAGKLLSKGADAGDILSKLNTAFLFETESSAPMLRDTVESVRSRCSRETGSFSER